MSVQKMFSSHSNWCKKRIDITIDEDDRVEIAKELQSNDPLKFVDSKKYVDRVKLAKKETNEFDALVVFRGKVKGENVVCTAFEFEFLGGSMGSVVGENFLEQSMFAVNLISH